MPECPVLHPQSSPSCVNMSATRSAARPSVEAARPASDWAGSQDEAGMKMVQAEDSGDDR